MPKDEQGRELQKHTLNLYAGHFERLNELFPEAGSSRVIRAMVDDLIKRTEGEKPNVDIDLGNIGSADEPEVGAGDDGGA